MKKGWEIKKLGEVCEFQNGFAFKSNLFTEDGLPILRISNIQDFCIDEKDVVFFNPKSYKENFNRFKVFPNDIVIAMSGGTTGKLGINNTDTIFYLNQRVGKFTPKKDIERLYLFYFLQTKSEESLKIAAGAAQPNLSTEQIKNFSIPIPPLSEQKRIVSVLDAAFAKIEAVKEKKARNLQNAKELFQSELQKCMSPQSSTNKKGWEIKTLGEVAEIRPSKNDIIKNLKNNDEVSFLPMEDLGIMNYYINAKQKRELKEVNGSYTCFADGNVLLAKVTPCFENGKLGIAKNLINGVGFGSSEYIVFKPSQVLKSEFLYYLLSTFKFREDGKKHMLGACGLKRLSKDFVANFSIFVPPLSEQQQIVSRLDALSAQVKQLEANYKAVLANCEELKQSVLAKMFNGEI